MEKKVLGPLLLVILIVGSMISWGILELKKQQEEQPLTPEQPTEPTPENFPQIAFYADDVDANIHELAALYPIYGFTNETNLMNVAQSIQSLESVERVFSPEFYDPVPEKERFMPFYAEIVPTRDSNIERVMEEIESEGILTELEAYRKAVVKIPQKLTLYSLQRDLNISRDHNFEEPFAICTVTTDSMVGDRLKIRLILSMRGDQVLRETMEAYMKENLSAMPQIHQAMVAEKISSIDRMLGFERSVEILYK